MAKTEQTEGDLLADVGTDGHKWAQAFIAKEFKPDEIDEGLMIGWFCNAIEAGRSAGSALAEERGEQLAEIAEQGMALATRFVEAGLEALIVADDGPATIDNFVTKFKEMESERDTLRNDLAVATEKADAKALKEAGKAKATPAARRDTARALGPLKLKGDAKPLAGEDLMAAIAAADVVEVAFSDGKREIKQLPAQLIQGDAWQLATNGVRLRVDKLPVYGPNRDEAELKLAGYALMIDGEQVAYAARIDVLTLKPGGTYDLKDDVIF